MYGAEGNDFDVGSQKSEIEKWDFVGHFETDLGRWEICQLSESNIGSERTKVRGEWVACASRWRVWRLLYWEGDCVVAWNPLSVENLRIHVRVLTEFVKNKISVLARLAGVPRATEEAALVRRGELSLAVGRGVRWRRRGRWRGGGGGGLSRGRRGGGGRGRR